MVEEAVKLFHCSDETGRMKIKEVLPFDQKVIRVEFAKIVYYS